MEIIKHLFNFSQIVQSKLFATLFVIIFLFIVRRIIFIVVSRSTKDVKVQYGWRKSSAYTVFGIGFIIIGILVWSVFTIGSVALRNPFAFIFAIIGLGFLFGDDDCDL